MEIEFSIGSRSIKVRRGIKPNLFEIYVNDELINQDSTSKDYQDHLEKHILKMNYKSFTQIVILGSATFTPFMRLPALDRRHIIEDLLDIQIFSIMNALCKEKISTNRTRATMVGANLKSVRENIAYIEGVLEESRSNDDSHRKALLKEIEDFTKQIDDLKNANANTESTISILTNEINVLSLGKLDSQEEMSIVGALKSKLKTATSDISFYTENDVCPSCDQSIDHDHKAKTIEQLQKSAKEYEKALNELQQRISAINAHRTKYTQLQNEVINLRREIDLNATKITHLQMNIASREKALQEGINTALIGRNETELANAQSSLAKLTELERTLLVQREYLETAEFLLKDKGIKATVIKRYLPIINRTIQNYLNAMGFSVGFTLDENFREKLLSRYRDEFSYENFSEGEKAKIDIALLLTWRQIARMKNSVSTNLLIMDEIFDSSLDSTGIEEFIKIMNDLIKDNNVIIISHKRDQMLDKFDRVLLFEKSRNFSTFSEM